MKTTLDLDDDLLRRAKQTALDQRTSLRAVVEDALRRALGADAARVPVQSVVWPSHRSGDGERKALDPTDWMAAIKAVRYGTEPPENAAPKARGRASRVRRGQ